MISKDEIKHIADLSMLNLTDEIGRASCRERV